MYSSKFVRAFNQYLLRSIYTKLQAAFRGTILSRRANASLMPTLEIDKAAIDPAIAEVRDDATPTDFLMLGD